MSSVSCWCSNINESFKRKGLMSNRKLFLLSACVVSAPDLPQMGMLRTSVRSGVISLVIRCGGRQTHMGIVGYLVLWPE